MSNSAYRFLSQAGQSLAIHAVSNIKNMKVVLLSLIGSSDKALHALAERYSSAEIQKVTRQELEASGSSSARIGFLRRLRPDVFVVLTQQLEWQRGKRMFLLFGALAGARECCILDIEGNILQSSSRDAILKSPVWLAGELVSTASAYSKSFRQLRLLEKRCRIATKFRSDVAANTSPTIAYIRATPGSGKQAGGAASHIKGVIGALSQLGASVEVITNDAIAGLDGIVKSTVLIPSGAGITRAAFDLDLNFSFTEKAVDALKRINPDVIYQRYARFNWTGVMAALKLRRPLFLEYNGSEVWVGRHWDRVGSLGLLARFEELNLRAAAKIFVVSEVEARNLKARGIPDEKIVVNPNGVDTELFKPDVGGTDLRRELGIDEREVVVGFVGTFGPWHGVLILAEAIKSLANEPDLRFLIVGTGSLQIEMERMLASEISSRRVIFTGAIAHEVVPRYLDACNILVAPHVPLADGSDFFGSPTKLFEYMAMAKGIVASRLGQIGDVLVNEETGLLVEPGNAEELSAAILRLANTRDLRERLGANARRVAGEKYTWRHNAQRVLDAYKNLTG